MNKPPAAIRKGFVYLGKMLNFPNCYKIGSCSDFIQREDQISNTIGDCSVFLVWECLDALKAERAIQMDLRKFANIRVYGKESSGQAAGAFPGSKNSKEFFTFTPVQLFYAMHILTTHCQNCTQFEIMTCPASGGEGA